MIFQEPPSDFNKEIDVVGCYVEFEGKIVLLHRHAHKSSGNKLGLPAGKVDPGETIHQAMRREIEEETRLLVEEDDLEHIGSVYVRNEGHDLEYHMFITRPNAKPEIVINPAEHQGHLWITPSEAIARDLVHDLAECIQDYYEL